MVVAEQHGFAVKLKALREAAGLTPYQLAKKAKLSGQAINLLEEGRRQPSWATVLKLSRALGVSVSEFDTGEQFNAEEPPEPPQSEPTIQSEPPVLKKKPGKK